MAFEKPKKPAATKAAPTKGNYQAKQAADPLNAPLFQFLSFLVKIPNKYAKIGDKPIVKLMLAPLLDVGLEDYELLGLLINVEKPNHTKALKYELERFIDFNDKFNQYPENAKKLIDWANDVLADLP